MPRDPRGALVALATLPLFGATAALAVPQTVGLLLNTPDAFPGYTLFGPRDWPVTYLIDIEGNLVHSWQHVWGPKNVSYLLENGHLVRSAKTVNAVFDHRGSAGRLQDWDWDGTLQWEFLYSNDQVCGHHDIEPMPNGNLLVIAWEYKSVEEAIAAGRDPALLRDALWPGHVVEIEPVGSSGANIVWEWHAWDHLIQDFDSTKANWGVVADHPELIDVNEPGTTHEDWLHFNAIDYDEALDQIVLSTNRLKEIWIIDHGTTTEEAAGHTGGARGRGGDLLWRWGNPANYDRGSGEDQRLFGQHDVQWIEAGHPGAGHLLIFNNGNARWPTGTSYSSVDEIVTPVDANGDYPVPLPGEPHGPADALWTYASDPPEEFHSSFYGGVQRLPNGSTLVIESDNGRIFELDSGEQIVWEYVVPVNGNGPIVQGWIPEENAAFRAPRFAPDYPAFDGRDLKSQGPIELDPTAVAGAGPAPVLLTLAPNAPNPFREATTIAFALPEAASVTLDVFDVAGRRVATLLDRRLEAGAHRHPWRPAGLPSGVYYCTLRAGPETVTRPVTLLR